MAFRASNLVPAKALEQAKATALRVKQLAQSYSTRFLAATTRRDDVIHCWQEMAGISLSLVALRNTPGLAAYATAQENDAGYDVAAEFNALISKVDAVVSEIQTVFPNTNGFLLVAKFHVNGTLDHGTFTAAQLATL